MGIAISGHGSGQGRRHDKAGARNRRHLRVRKKISGTAQRPRLVVTRSLRHMVVQVVDDSTGRTLASASSMEADLREASGDKTAKARSVGERVAERAKTAGIQTVWRHGRQPLPARRAAIGTGRWPGAAG